MHTPKSSTLYELQLDDHNGPDSLDMIIRRLYDRRLYIGQQTGEMMDNDSSVTWDFSTTSKVDERLSTYGRDDAGKWVPMDLIQRWLDRPEPVMSPGYGNVTSTWKGGYWSEGDRYAMDYMRAAPEPDLLLADLIRRGEMPYGRYLIHCWW